MALRCKCGSQLFEPLGIQEYWKKGDKNVRHRVLFLVNCKQCRTTLACSRLDYALMRSHQAEQALSISFFTADQPSAA